MTKVFVFRAVFINFAIIEQYSVLSLAVFMRQEESPGNTECHIS